MALRTWTTIESDLTGKPDAETVRFGLEGSTYEIDLTADEAERLRKALARYVEHGRKVSPNGTNGQARKGKRG